MELEKPSVSTSHYIRTAKLCRFSSCNGEDFAFKEIGLSKVTFYANGNSTKNEGHVSIIFELLGDESVTFSCVAAVVDASGNKRFSQSFAYSYGVGVGLLPDSLFEVVGFERFLQRSTLLSDPSEFLPDDTLTICLEIDFELLIDCRKDIRGYYHVEDGQCFLRMDDKYGRDLCKVSSVFKDMVEFSSGESGTTEFVPISYEDFVGLAKMFVLLCKDEFEVTVSYLCDFYVVADKYDVRPFLDSCPRLLACIMRAINTKDILEHVDGEIHVISELSERFDGVDKLREVLAIYSDIKNKLEGGVGELDASGDSEREKIWICRHKKGNYFRFIKINSESVEMDAFK